MEMYICNLLNNLISQICKAIIIEEIICTLENLNITVNFFEDFNVKFGGTFIGARSSYIYIAWGQNYH